MSILTGSNMVVDNANEEFRRYQALLDDLSHLVYMKLINIAVQERFIGLTADVFVDFFDKPIDLHSVAAGYEVRSEPDAHIGTMVIFQMMVVVCDVTERKIRDELYEYDKTANILRDVKDCVTHF